MYCKNDITYLRRKLLEWFTSNQRDFPWRKEGATNYQIIISEILLQKTKAETVAKFLPTFLNKFPDWESLIHLKYKEVEELLKPLGLYKQRAKRIFKLANELEERNIKLPQNSDELKESNLSALYISGAFELFVLKRKAPLLDVNMARVLSRYFQINVNADLRRDKDFQDLSKKVINVKKCKELNWAILDFASIICKARNPNCINCILKFKCEYFKNR